MIIKFTVPLELVPFVRPCQNGRRRFNDPRYSEFKAAVALYARRAMNGRAPFTGAMKISVDTYRKYKPTSRQFGDGDNHLKSIMDALNGICYADDSQIVCGTFTKNKGEPHIDIQLEEVTCGR